MPNARLPLRIALACLIYAAASPPALAAALFGCTDGLYALSNNRYTLDLGLPQALTVTQCEPLASSTSQASGGGKSSASAVLSTTVANGVKAVAAATTVQSHVLASASGIARLVFRVHSDTLAPGTTIPLSYSLELLTVDSQIDASGVGSVSLSGRGFFGLGTYDPVQDNWGTVGPTGGPLLPLTAVIGPGQIVSRTDQPLYVQIGGTFYLYFGADAVVTVNALGGATTLNSAAGLLAVQLTGSLTAPASAEIEWLAHETLGLPLPQIGDLGFTPVPLPAGIWLLASGLLLLGRARCNRQASAIKRVRHHCSGMVGSESPGLCPSDGV